ncbi:hypothetical protein C8C83_4166 [Flavobacterium sp. 90]|uniref:hypothetical protein n=1 Tax=unclassified Flavobacterium TaxID=196869 RepID=UPI000EAF668B|nr:MULTISPECIES: hypothetical protein [unclassified Flavobacterium]RKR04833.1 hypothetical protein C8C82_4499 [Flavobacterium sp. 81]TCK56154.1 hypothetical protein C8C83_4166 [Flavobacterium sp. 90]
MTSNIKYKDFDGNYIPEQKVSDLKFYSKEFFNNDELKLVEDYGPKGRTNEIILRGGEYYLSADEDLQTIVNQHKSTGNYWSFFYNKQQNSLGDTCWEYHFYKKGELNRSGIKVFNTDNLLIASCTIDLETSEIDNKRKYFYGDPNIYKRPEYESHFLSVSYHRNNDVSDIYIYDDDYQSADEFLASFDSKYFDWALHPYFHSFMPIMQQD